MKYFPCVLWKIDLFFIIIIININININIIIIIIIMQNYIMHYECW